MDNIQLRILILTLLLSLVLVSCSKSEIDLDLDKINNYHITYLGDNNELVNQLADSGINISQQIPEAKYTGDILIIDNDFVSQLNANDIKDYLLTGNFVFVDRANNTQQVETKFTNEKSYEYIKDEDRNVLLQLQYNKEQFFIRTTTYETDELKYQRLIQSLFALLELES